MTLFLEKQVHFPETREDGLESECVFRRKARPASSSLIGSDDTESETESEPESNTFPFPRFSATCKGTPQFLTILALSDIGLIRLQRRITSDRIALDQIALDQITSDSVGWQPCLPVMVVY